MSDNPRQAAGSAEHAARQTAGAFEQMGRRAANWSWSEGWDGAIALLRANEVFLRGLGSWYEEMSRFINGRVQHTVETSESLKRCRSASEALDTQREFARATSERYFEQGAKLLNIAARTAKESLEPVQDYLQETTGRAGEARESGEARARSAARARS
jgi:hypothetical protein